MDLVQVTLRFLFSLSSDLLFDFSSTFIDPIASITLRKTFNLFIIAYKSCSWLFSQRCCHQISLISPLHLLMLKTIQQVFINHLWYARLLATYLRLLVFPLVLWCDSCWSPLEDILIISHNQVHLWPQCLCRLLEISIDMDINISQMVISPKAKDHTFYMLKPST